MSDDEPLNAGGTAPDQLRSILRVIGERSARRVVIDGRSGAGKTTLAEELTRQWAGSPVPRIVSLDEIYPGWGGLREGSALALALVLEPHVRGGIGRYRRFDWERGTFGGAEIFVEPDVPIIVEGSGALTAETAALADVSVWLDGPVDERRERALARDAGGFDASWDMWAAQEDEHIRLNAPRSLATLGFWMAR